MFFFLVFGFGLEDVQLDVMQCLFYDLVVGIFIKEFIIDKFVYGIVMGGFCFVVFILVVYGVFGFDGLGELCNLDYLFVCDFVFRVRVIIFVILMFLLLVIVWELKYFI